MGNLIPAGRGLGDGAAVNHNGLRPQAPGAADRVHRHVAAAHHQNALGVLDVGGEGVVVQVHLGEVIVGRPHPGEAGVQPSGRLGHIGAIAHKDGLIARGKKVVHALVLVDGRPGDDLHTPGLQGFDLPVHHRVGQDELGNAVGQNAAGIGQFLKNGHVITHGGQVTGTGDAGGAGPDHRHLFALLLHLRGGDGMAGGVPVGHKPLQTADAHGLTLNRVGAVLFTLLLLGADPPADGGHGASHGDNVIGPFKVPLCHAGNELGDLLVNGAAGHAGLFAAVQAAHGLPNGVGLGIAQSHLVEVGAANFPRLLRHGISFSYVVNHLASPSFGSRLLCL